MANTAGTIKRRYQVTGTNRTTPQISKDRYNDSLVVASAAADGKVALKDSAQSDGWAFGEAPVSGGGTGAATLTDRGVLVGRGTSPVEATAAGANWRPLLGTGASSNPAFNAVTLAIALTDGATPALDASLVPWWVTGKFRLAAGGNRTIAVPTNATDGQKIVIEHYASGGARTLALNSGAGGFRFGSDITALSATASGKTDYIGCIYNATDSKWDVVAVTKGF